MPVGVSMGQTHAPHSKQKGFSACIAELNQAILTAYAANGNANQKGTAIIGNQPASTTLLSCRLLIRLTRTVLTYFRRQLLIPLCENVIILLLTIFTALKRLFCTTLQNPKPLTGRKRKGTIYFYYCRNRDGCTQPSIRPLGLDARQARLSTKLHL